ncbi:MAG: T9SS type A sorting domain-containing protein [Flavobacteriaceae bacterium]|nr:T9SS type A sorting domain-containing protein [Flavobacteriaceae bacterium]
MKSQLKKISGALLFMLIGITHLHCQIINDGVYQIYSETHDATLESPIDVNQDDSEDGQINNLFGSTLDVTNNFQLFEFIHQGSDIYKIKNLGTDQFVGIKDNWCGDNGEVIARFSETETNTEFSVSQDPTSGQLIIQIAFTECNFGSVNDPERSFDLGNPTGKVRTFGDTGSNQQFRLLNTSPIVNEGIYQIYSEVNDEAIVSPEDVNQDDSIDPQINNLFTETIDFSNDFQRFEFSYQYTNNKGDVYKIKNLGTNLFVGLKDNFCGDFGEVIARFNESDETSEVVVSLNSSGYYLFQKNSPDQSCSYFDLSGGASGAKIRTFNATGDNQQFRLLSESRSFDSGIYRVFSEVNNQFLESPTEVDQDASEDGQINNLFASDLNYSNDFQQFEFLYQFSNQNGDVYTIRNLGTNQLVGLKDNFCGDFGEVIAGFNEGDDEAQIVVSQEPNTRRFLFQKNDSNSCSYFDLTTTGKVRTFNDTGDNQQFIIIPDETFIFDESWLPSEPTATGGEDVFILNGNYTTLTNVAFNSIFVTSDASVEIGPENVLTLSENLTNNGEFTFQSNASGTAQLESFEGVIMGEITTERFIPAQRAFRFLSSPIHNVSIEESWQQAFHITGSQGNVGETSLEGFDQTITGNPSMFTFDAMAQEWNAIPNTINTQLEIGKAYRALVRGSRNTVNLADNDSPTSEVNLSTKGTMQTGSFPLPNLANEALQFSFVGNPYQAVVDFNSVNKSGITNFIYVWDVNLGENGAYVTVDLDNSSINPGSSTVTNYIAPGQAFFVQNLEAPELIQPSITFEEEHKATQADQAEVFNTYSNFYINSRLYKTSDFLSGNQESDALGLRFSNSYTTLGSDEDGSKFSNPEENYAVVNNGLRSIDKQDIPHVGHEIQLYIANYKTENYSLTFDLDNQPEGLSVYLNDNYLGTTVELEADFVYEFNVDVNITESTSHDRFLLTFDEPLAVEHEGFESDFTLFPNPTETGLFTIQTFGLNHQEIDLQIFTMLGKQVLSQKTQIESNGAIHVDASTLSTGMYLVELQQGEQKFISKLIKN